MTEGSEGERTHALEKAARHGSAKMICLATPTNAQIGLAMVQCFVDVWANATSEMPLIGVDNTMLGPVLQRPIEMGASICVHSLTKDVGGDPEIIPTRVLHPAMPEGDASAKAYPAQCTWPGSTRAFVVEDDRALAFRRAVAASAIQTAK